LLAASLYAAPASLERKAASDHWDSDAAVLSNSTCVGGHAPAHVGEISIDLERGGDAEDEV